MGCAWTHSSYTKLMHANATIGETKSTSRAMYFSVPGVAYQIRCSLVRNSAGARYDARVPGMFSAATVQFTLLSHPQGQMYSRKPPTLGQLLDAVVREGVYATIGDPKRPGAFGHSKGPQEPRYKPLPPKTKWTAIIIKKKARKKERKKDRVGRRSSTLRRRAANHAGAAPRLLS